MKFSRLGLGIGCDCILPGTLRTEIFDSPRWQEELAQDWRRLFGESETATPFQSWEWQTTWAKYFLRKGKPRIFAFYEGQDLVGLFPAFRSQYLWRALRPMGLGLSDYLLPLARKGFDGEVAQALLAALDGQRDVDLADLHEIREGHPLVAGQSTIRQSNCLVVDLPPTFGEYVSGLGKNLRYKLSKQRRQMQDSGRAIVEWLHRENVGEVSDALFRLHESRWRKRLLPGVFVGKRRQAFHREFLRLGADSGLAFVSVLRSDGAPVGAVYCMRANRGLYYYQAGFDPNYGHLSPGTLLLAESIRRGIEEGADLFDMMRGDEPYKRRWKPTREHANVRLLLSLGGARSKLGEAVNRASAGVEARLKARFEGRGLV